MYNDISYKIRPVLDKNFIPAVIYNREFLKTADTSISIAIERELGLVYRCDTKIGASKSENKFYIERLIKMLLWAVGGFKIYIDNEEIYEYIKQCYSENGLRAFDMKFMSRVYEKPFEVVNTKIIPETKNNPVAIGRHLDGCRIGFDAGGSDMKVSAVVDGEVIYSEEIVWFPKLNDNPEYHYELIEKAIKTAADKMERVDAIGISSAGVYINNRAMVASLFIKIPEDLFDKRIKDIYKNIAGDIPVVVANDGDVAALAGSMHLNKNSVLGVAMGTSEAVGYVDTNGNITGWLNELAFAPVDFNKNSMVDEWSGDFGCGCKYFSQDAVIKLAPKAGIALSENLSLAEKLKEVQKLLEQKQPGAIQIFETIGVYFGYAIAYYSEFYDIDYLQILGRVTSGIGGDIIIEKANQVLTEEFPDIKNKTTLYVPDEYERRVGQSIAAASLPNTNI